jgi:hypothetical protein
MAKRKVVAAGGMTAELVAAIASRQWTAQELSKIFNRSVDELRAFVDEHLDSIEEAREVYDELEAESAQELTELWIANKFERLRRLQKVAEVLYEGAIRTYDATILRELRSYLALASNELGQLMHRGSGDNQDGAVANYLIDGVDVNDLR